MVLAQQSFSENDAMKRVLIFGCTTTAAFIFLASILSWTIK